MTSVAAFLGAFTSSDGGIGVDVYLSQAEFRSMLGPMRPHAREYLTKWVERNYDPSRGTVTIEEVDSDTTVIVPDEGDEGN